MPGRSWWGGCWSSRARRHWPGSTSADEPNPPTGSAHRGRGAFTLEGLPPGPARVDFTARDDGEETHIAEHTEVEPTPGKPVVDVGTIKLMKGSFREKCGDEC